MTHSTENTPDQASLGSRRRPPTRIRFRAEIAGAVLILTTAALAFVYFSPLLGLWLAALAGLAWLRPIWAVCLLFLAISLDAERPVMGGIFVSYSELEFGVCLMAWLSREHRLRGLSGIDWWPLAYGLPFAGAVLLSGLWSTEPYRIIPHLVRQSEIMLAALLAAGALSAKGSDRPMKAAILSAALFYPALGLLGDAPESSRAYSAFSNPNQFAGYLNLLLPFLASFFCFGPRLRDRMLWGAPALLILASLSTTVSRTAMVGAAAALATVGSSCFVGRSRKATASAQSGDRLKKYAPKAIAGALALSLFAAAAAQTRLGPLLIEKGRIVYDRFSTESLKHSLQERMLLWGLGQAIWADHWLLGVGPGNYVDVAPRYWPGFEERAREVFGVRAQKFKYPNTREVWTERHLERLRRVSKVHIHNLYLQLAIDFGLLGLAGFLLFVGLALRHLLRSPTGPWRLGGLGLAAAFLVHNLLDATFPSLGLETGLLLGAAMAGGARRQDRAAGSGSVQGRGDWHVEGSD